MIWLYVMVLLSASVKQFFDPANDSVLPEVATDEELGAANSLMAIAQFGSTAIGFALAGLLAAIHRSTSSSCIDAGTFAVRRAADLPGQDQAAGRRGADHGRDMIRNLEFGAKFILRDPILRSMTLLRVPVMVIFGLQNVLLLPFALDGARTPASSNTACRRGSPRSASWSAAC